VHSDLDPAEEFDIKGEAKITRRHHWFILRWIRMTRNVEQQLPVIHVLTLRCGAED
jgi:hypothetical protein